VESNEGIQMHNLFCDDFVRDLKPNKPNKNNNQNKPNKNNNQNKPNKILFFLHHLILL